MATNSIAEGKNRPRPRSTTPLPLTGGGPTDAIRHAALAGRRERLREHRQLGARSPAAPAPAASLLDGVCRSTASPASCAPGSRQRLSDLRPHRPTAGRQFFGAVPGAGGAGFLLDPVDAGDHARCRGGGGVDYSQVVAPLRSSATTSRRATRTSLRRRWVIDARRGGPLEEAERWPARSQVVRRRVKPHPRCAPEGAGRRRPVVEASPRSVRGLFVGRRGPLRRFIARPATSKRIFMVCARAALVPLQRHQRLCLRRRLRARGCSSRGCARSGRRNARPSSRPGRATR
ncbi:MAG: hypothetical protein WKG07_08890 [Hymenobacter sp.]